MISWLHCSGPEVWQSIISEGCGGRKLLSSQQSGSRETVTDRDREREERQEGREVREEGLGKRNTLPRMSPVTYFLQTYPTFDSFQGLPVVLSADEVRTSMIQSFPQISTSEHCCIEPNLQHISLWGTFHTQTTTLHLSETREAALGQASKPLLVGVPLRLFPAAGLKLCVPASWPGLGPQKGSPHSWAHTLALSLCRHPQTRRYFISSTSFFFFLKGVILPKALSKKICIQSLRRREELEVPSGSKNHLAVQDLVEKIHNDGRTR